MARHRGHPARDTRRSGASARAHHPAVGSAGRRHRHETRSIAAHCRGAVLVRQRDPLRARAGPVRRRSGQLVARDAAAAEQDGADGRRQLARKRRVVRPARPEQGSATPLAQLRLSRVRARRHSAGRRPQRRDRPAPLRAAGGRRQRSAHGDRHGSTRSHPRVRRIAHRGDRDAGVSVVAKTIRCGDRR